MSALSRMLVSCLLALVLPVQAVLAATGAFCTAHQHGSRVAQPAAHAVAGTIGGTVGPHVACEHASAADAGPAPPAAPTEGAAAADAGCSACAACCAPGAVSAPAHGLPLADIGPTVFRDVPAAIEAFASDGPDRPPRGGIE